MTAPSLLDTHCGDALDVLRSLPAESVHCVVTSPPYFGLRDYGVAGQIGLEATLDDFLERLVGVFREVRRVLRSDGTAWVNMGDTYATNGGPGWQGKNGQRSDRRFTGTRNTVAMQAQARTAAEGFKPKNMMGVPWRLAFALQAGFSTCSACEVERRTDLWPIHNGHRVCVDCLLAGRLDSKVKPTERGWFLRQDIVWHKPNPMPESVRDRCTKAHEYLFLLSKSERYYYDAANIKEPVTGSAHARGNGVNPKAYKTPDGWDTSKGAGVHGSIHRTGREKGAVKQNESFSKAIAGLVDNRNKRSVWTVPSHPYKEAHFATYPPALIKPCILAGTRPGDTVLDPFAGSGTTGAVALELGRRAVLIELNPDYVRLILKRCHHITPGMALSA